MNGLTLLAEGAAAAENLSMKRGGDQITVFTAPTPFRSGAVDIDISALVQGASTGDPMTPVKVTVRMTKPGRLALEYQATTEAATNSSSARPSSNFRNPVAGFSKSRSKDPMGWP